MDKQSGITKTSAQKQTSSNRGGSVGLTNDQYAAKKRFEEACAQIKANVMKHVTSIDVTDEESSDEESYVSSDVVAQVFQSYGRDSSTGERATSLLADALKGGSTVCLICIASIRKVDAVWSCVKCYCHLHLTCIQRWAKDSIFHQSEAAADRLPPGAVVDMQKFSWCCPKCREEYSQQLIPTKYVCYCKKVVDPKFDPWLLPHSCGQTCGKQLEAKCNHTCLLLCHPGPCPPCPKMVSVSCYCRKQQPQPRRCSSQAWACGSTCGKLLSCKQHRCTGPCHGGECPPCPNRSIQKCLCGRESTERPCDSVSWQCQTVCERKLSCGHHECSSACHAGPCPPCPLSLKRTCPCGKKDFLLPCTADTGTCGDTCGKPLACGVHLCAERCHKGNCGTCLQMRLQRCRCGAKEKELPCYKQFTCEVKCKQIKDCRRHPCNRKCCPGNCPPCDQPCNRTLGCKNHKCASRCHPGSCYPCPLMVDLRCACGSTVLTVPCGSEKFTKPPKCTQRCMKPPNCHHPERTKHSCHFGDCPPCRQPCEKVRPSCGHVCRAPCHTAVLVQVNNGTEAPRSGPWEPKVAPKMEIRQLPCPPCQIPMPVTCLGSHETSDWPCHLAVPSSCQRPCGRALQCSNHFCAKPCHLLSDESRGEAWSCDVCEQPCARPRPADCTHPCPRGACHPGCCPPCTKLTKHSCHCAINARYVRCVEWSDALNKHDDALKEELLCCKDQCPKLLACGHRCSRLCHSGECTPVEQCTSSVQISCPCKRIKRSVLCSAAAGQAGIVCDEICRQKKDQGLKAMAEKERQRLEEEEKKNREELEKFERKFGQRKKRSDRKRQLSGEAQSIWPAYVKIIGAVLVIGACIAGLLLQHSSL